MRFRYSSWTAGLESPGTKSYHSLDVYKFARSRAEVDVHNGGVGGLTPHLTLAKEGARRVMPISLSSLFFMSKSNYRNKEKIETKVRYCGNMIVKLSRKTTV